ncbi:MAG: alkaline phosphatase D family protein, partial [bacterium]
VLCVDSRNGLAWDGNPWTGTIRKEPVDTPVLSVAAFTGNQNVGHPADGDRRRDGWVDSPEITIKGEDVRWTRENIWFPHEDLVAGVLANSPDLLVFTGDQVYEGDSPTEAEKSPEEVACLDYLYKWYLWFWAYRDLVSQYPTVCIPDDHDVFQGNLWGWEGRHVSMNNADGGYVMNAEFVKMVERTQTGNLPDPYDPTPIKRGIGVYYTSLKYGGVDFAILEDRKFKTPSAEPFRSEINEQVAFLRKKKGPTYAPRKYEVPEGSILGDRQLSFLRDWATDWKGVEMKVAVSQTIFASVNTGGSIELRRPKRDYDSNGWSPAARNQALLELRKAFAFMIGGDQHLGSIVHHGVDEFGDAGYSLCVPSIANYWTRYWSPIDEGGNRNPDNPRYTGDFFDGFGNRITVYAVANPKGPSELTPLELRRGRTELYRKAVGYGVARFNKAERTIRLECWPRWADPAEGDENQFPGWPLNINQEENYPRSSEHHLALIRVKGMVDPVVQILHEETGEIVYSLRVKGVEHSPRVPVAGTYSVLIGEPGTKNWKKLTGLETGPLKEGDEVLVEFN